MIEARYVNCVVLRTETIVAAMRSKAILYRPLWGRLTN